MYCFFVSPEETKGEFIDIKGNDVNHIKNVLRMKIGDEILVSDGNDREFYCIINSFSNDFVRVKIVDVLGESKELPVKITLFQGLPKSDKMEFIIQKAVELGAYEIVPVITKCTVVKLDDKKQNKKLERWNTISLTASKQAKRGIIPKVREIVSFKQALEMAKDFDLKIVPYEDAKSIFHSREIIKSSVGKKNIGVFIGPEGGFEQAEIDLAMENGFIPITLGKRILRTETAGLTVLSILMFELDED